MKLAEVAARIHAHLKRFEADPAINVVRNGLNAYWNVRTVASGSRVFVTYVAYQGLTSLSKADALAYLEWLDAGNIGKHFVLERLKAR